MEYCEIYSESNKCSNYWFKNYIQLIYALSNLLATNAFLDFIGIRFPKFIRVNS